MKLIIQGFQRILHCSRQIKKLAIAIDTYGESVSSISYKIRDSRDMSLIESTKVENFDSSPSRVEAVLNIKESYFR